MAEDRVTRPGTERRFPGCFRVFVYLLAGLAVLDALVRAGQGTWRIYDPDDYLERLQSCQRRPRDLVVVGGSPVSEGIDPSELAGLSWRNHVLQDTFNLGLPGATTSEVWHAVRHGMPTPPKLLLYGITCTDLNDGRQEPHGAYSLMDTNDWYEWVSTRPRSAEWITRHYVRGRLARLWGLYYYGNGIRLWAADQSGGFVPGFCPKAAEDAKYNLAYTTAMRGETGFAPERLALNRRLDALDEEDRKKLLTMFGFLRNFHMGEHLAYLHRILDWAEERGVSVVLIDMPVAPELEEGKYKNQYAAYREALAEVGRARTVPILWASRKAVGLNDGHLADLVHLNKTGTKRLSRWIRKQLPRLPADATAYPDPAIVMD